MICEKGKIQQCADAATSDSVDSAVEVMQKFLNANSENAGKFLITALSDIVKVTVKKVIESRSDTHTVIKGLVIGILKLCKNLDENIYEIINYLTTLIIGTVKECQGNLPLAAQALAEGIWEATRELNIDVRRCVLEAATTAVITTYEVDALTGEKVKEALIDTITEIDIISLGSQRL
jgi:hypothetical protein